MRSDQMMYKNFNNMAPEYFRDLFKSEHKTHERSLRSVDKELLNIPFCRTSYYFNSFTLTGAREWNVLPLVIRKLSTIQSFKTPLKRIF